MMGLQLPKDPCVQVVFVLFFLVNTRWQLPLFGSGFVEADGYLGHSSLIVLWQIVILFLVLHVDIPIINL